MTVLVFGGTGLIGEAITKGIGAWLTSYGGFGDVTALDSACDICNEDDVSGALNEYEPSVVINAAWPADVLHMDGFDTVMVCAIDYWKRNRVPKKHLSEKGCLINIASVYATLPPRFEMYPDGMDKDPAYVAAKAGIVQLTRYWARKARGTGIRVNAVSPGGVYRSEPTEFVQAYSRHTNHGRMLPASAVADACRFLVECPWITGVNLVVDDGFSL